MITPLVLRSFDELAIARPVVKICGLREARHVAAAVARGADMIGFVFAESRRQVSPAGARALRDTATAEGSARPLFVGVFVNEAPDSIRRIADEVGLDVVQLSGDESPEEVAACAAHRPVLKALRFGPGTTVEEAARTAAEYGDAAASGRVRLLVDAHHATEYGGTGAVADWSLAAAVAARHNIMLAGGLTPRNLRHALGSVAPWGVDVSSGVEIAGAKDTALITEFITEARKGAI